MCLLAALAILIDYLVCLLGFRGEESQSDLEVVVAHADGAASIPRSYG